MNKSVVYVLVFAAGAGAGFLVGKQIFEKKYAALAQEEIDSVKETFGRVVKNAKEKLLPEDDETDAGNVHPVGHQFVRSSLGNEYERAKQNYNLFKEARPLISDRGEEIEEIVEVEVIPEIDNSKPYLIDDTQYAEECDHFAKLSLVYYLDGVLCDESETMIDDIEHTIGQEAYHLLLMHPANMWVRNELISADYEIIALHSEYGEDVLTTDSRVGKRDFDDNEDD